MAIGRNASLFASRLGGKRRALDQAGQMMGRPQQPKALCPDTTFINKKRRCPKAAAAKKPGGRHALICRPPDGCCKKSRIRNKVHTYLFWRQNPKTTNSSFRIVPLWKSTMNNRFSIGRTTNPWSNHTDRRSDRIEKMKEVS